MKASAVFRNIHSVRRHPYAEKRPLCPLAFRFLDGAWGFLWYAIGSQQPSPNKQRTAVEPVFSQAFAPGIERPKLRNQQAIANQNTLIDLLIHLRAMQRVLHKLPQTNL